MDPATQAQDAQTTEPHADPLVAVTHALERGGLTIAVAESCTGGLLGGALTEVSGASRYFMGGIIAYDNSIKEQILGVPADLLEQHGAVSHEVAAAMAAGVRKQLDTALGIAITGIAGPDGGTPNKPVGTTYVSLAARDAVITRHFHFHGERAANRTAAVQAALHLIIDYVEDTLRRTES